MPAGALILYNHMALLGGNGVNLATDTLNISLHSSGYVPNLEHEVYADVSASELATANGYTNGGAALTGKTWTRTAGVGKLDSNDQVWTAAGGPITARYAVVRSVTANKLIGYMLLDATPADLTATDGNTMTVGPHAANGWFNQTVNP